MRGTTTNVFEKPEALKMVCLECGCDTWFEFKNNMKITTAEDCKCSCHKDQVNKKSGVADEM